MRNVFAGILLAMSLPAMAFNSSTSDQLKAAAADLSPVALEAVNKMLERCGADCSESDLVVALNEAGLSSVNIATITVNAGLNTSEVSQALTQTGGDTQSFEQAVATLNANTQESPATGPGVPTRRLNTPVVEQPAVPPVVEPNPNQVGSPT